MLGLIYDIGLHAGEDSEFYLRKGFRVVGVDADDAMCRKAAERLRPFVESGQLTIVHVAIADRPGTKILYRSSHSQWSTLIPAWRDQNAARKAQSTPLEVDAITLAQLVQRYGDAYYMKLDIEGMDLDALRTLKRAVSRPPFVSIESAFPRKPSFKSINDEFETLASLGYDQFKIVPQHLVDQQEPPRPALVGRYVPFQFEPGSSGLFGDEAPGSWMTLQEALAAFRSIARQSWLPALLHKRMAFYSSYCRWMERLTGGEPEIGWYDIHAKRGDADAKLC